MNSLFGSRVYILLKKKLACDLKSFAFVHIPQILVSFRLDAVLSRCCCFFANWCALCGADLFFLCFVLAYTYTKSTVITKTSQAQFQIHFSLGCKEICTCVCVWHGDFNTKSFVCLLLCSFFYQLSRSIFKYSTKSFMQRSISSYNVEQFCFFLCVRRDVYVIPAIASREKKNQSKIFS